MNETAGLCINKSKKNSGFPTGTRNNITKFTSARLHWYPVTRSSALSARASGRVASGTLTTRAQLALRFCDAWEVSLLVPPWSFRPERERTPERGREKGLGAGYQAFFSKEVEQGTFTLSSMRFK